MVGLRRSLPPLANCARTAHGPTRRHPRRNHSRRSLPGDAPADGRVTLDRFDDPEHAIALVDARYACLAAADPTLANNLSIAAPEDLRHWHYGDQLRAIRRHDTTIGVLAIVPGAIGWITGEEINEEVISEPHVGQGYAASAQTAWARHVAADADKLLIGTVDRHNHASRATAQRVGRPRVLDDIFIALRASGIPLRDTM